MRNFRYDCGLDAAPLLKWFGAVLLALACGTALAQVRATLPFRTIDPALPPVSGLLGDSPKGKIEVIQFFYYACPHCFDQQPLIEDWLAVKPVDVEFRYIPALRDDKWVPLTKAFFALEKLGEAKRLHRPIYDVINFDSVNLSEEPKLFDWLARNGVDRARFIEAYNADDVKAKVDEARKLTAAYAIRTTPTLVVGGRFAVASGLAGSHHEALRMVNQFIGQVRAGQK